MKVDAYYVPRSCALVLIKHVYESVCGVMCALVGVTGVTSAVKVREVPRSTWICLPYFVVSLGIKKNTLQQGLWVTMPLLRD